MRLSCRRSVIILCVHVNISLLFETAVPAVLRDKQLSVNFRYLHADF